VSPRWSRRGATALLAGCAGVLASGCSELRFDLANLPALRGPFERLADVPYAPGVRHALDVYRPLGVRDAPVVVFWYGGAWVEGSKEDYRFVDAALAEVGCLALLPDYRLYPAVRFPAFLDDCARAVRWAIDNAAAHGGDPRRVYVAGHSAGAHMAAMLAVQPGRLAAAGADPSAIRGLIGLAGPYALQPNSRTLNAIFAPPYAMSDWQPVALVTPAAPPALLLHGAADELVQAAQSERFAAALRAAGVAAELEIYPGRTHADMVAAFSELARSRAPVLERIRRFVAATPAAAGAAAASQRVGATGVATRRMHPVEPRSA